MTKWLYIITWCIVTEIPCMQAPMKHQDKFGRDRVYETLEWCVEYEAKCGYERRIFNRDSAFAFYNEALEESVGIRLLWNYDDKRWDTVRFYRDGCLDKVKIDSIEVKLK